MSKEMDALIPQTTGTMKSHTTAVQLKRFYSQGAEEEEENSPAGQESQEHLFDDKLDHVDPSPHLKGSPVQEDQSLKVGYSDNTWKILMQSYF